MAADARGGERRARPRVQRGSRLLFLLGLFDFLLRASVLGHVILPYKWIITVVRGDPKTEAGVDRLRHLWQAVCPQWWSRLQPVDARLRAHFFSRSGGTVPGLECLGQARPLMGISHQ